VIYPFKSDNGTLLRDRVFLDFDLLKQIRATFSYKETRDFISLYITEGIPYAFKKNPLVYEDSRSWIAKHLETNPENITLTGSSRLGFSLNPKKLGTPYSENSDLDLIIVSRNIFEAYKNDFKLYVNDVKIDIEKKRKIAALSLHNIKYLGYTVNTLGFIDQFKIPINKRYSSVYKTYDVFAHLIERMKITPNCPNPYKVTARIYKDWVSCLNQLTVNFNSSLKAAI